MKTTDIITISEEVILHVVQPTNLFTSNLKKGTVLTLCPLQDPQRELDNGNLPTIYYTASSGRLYYVQLPEMFKYFMHKGVPIFANFIPEAGKSATIVEELVVTKDVDQFTDNGYEYPLEYYNEFNKLLEYAAEHSVWGPRTIESTYPCDLVDFVKESGIPEQYAHLHYRHIFIDRSPVTYNL